MALKPFVELYNLDISAHTRKRKDKGEEFTYLPWNACMLLLYENGASKVEFQPIYNENGHSLFVLEAGKGIEKDQQSKRPFEPMAPEVHVKVVVDDLSGEFSYPLINGKEVITMKKVNQQLVNTARQRAFVKGVAILTGLGLKLWEKDESEDNSVDDLSRHNIFAIKRRVEQLITVKMQKGGYDQRGLCGAIGIGERDLAKIMRLFDNINTLERKLNAL